MVNRVHFFALLLAFLSLVPTAIADPTFKDTRFVSQQVVSGLSSPVGFAFAPDGRIFVWEKSGRVRIIKDGKLLSTPFLDIRDHVNRNTDRGLMGLALHPDFASNGYVYLAYVFEDKNAPTSDQPRTQRITRVKADPANPDRALPEETVILGKVADPNCDLAFDCSPNNRNVHTINRLRFGPDGKLYVGIGDGADWAGVDQRRLRAQNLDSLNGKILRLNPDGTGPSDNPFYNGDPTANRSKVFAYGLRNPFTISFDSRDGSLYIGDVGSSYFEEVNRGKGANFGWPCFEGPNANPDHNTEIEACKSLPASAVTAPLYSYPRNTTTAACIVLGPVYSGSDFPAEYQGNLLVSDFVGKWIRRLPLEPGGAASAVQDFAANLGDSDYDGPVYLDQGPDGNLYYLLLSSGQLRKIDYTGSANQAPKAVLSANPTSGPSPLNVAFSSAGSSDPENRALTYSWDFGDGTTSTAENPSHRYTVSGVKTFTATLTVKDPEGSSGTASVNITVGSQPPVASIDRPSPGFQAATGQTVEFSGSATDPEDGVLTGASLNWEVIIQHNEHFHTMLDTAGAGGSFLVEAHGGVGDTYSYVIRLTATDSAGLTDVKEVRVGIAPPTPTLTLAPASGGFTSVAIRAGEAATFPLQISATENLQGRVDLTCANEPPHSTCVVSPASVELTASAPQPFTVTLRTSSTTQASGMVTTRPIDFPHHGMTWLTGLLAVALLGPLRIRVRPGIALVAMLAVGLMAGCAAVSEDRSGPPMPTPTPTPPGTYQVQVNATSGSLKSALMLNVTVQ